MKYTCKMKKSDIIEAILAEFEKAKAECEEFMGDSPMAERALGKYVAMTELLSVVKIYEED